jgi:hypothetical protein
VTRQQVSDKLAVAPECGPRPQKRDGIWQCQILLTEATMAKQISLVICTDEQSQLVTWLSAMGGRFEAHAAFTVFDDSRNKMIVRFGWLKKPRNAIAKALHKMDESKAPATAILLAGSGQ